MNVGRKNGCESEREVEIKGEVEKKGREREGSKQEKEG